MLIEFEAIRNKLEADRSAIISETVELCSGIVEDNEKGKIEDFDSRIEHGVGILRSFLALGSLIEFLNVEERSICEAQEEHDRYLEEKESAIIAKLEHAGVDLTGIVEPKDESKESGTVLPEPAEEIEERKKREIERIRRNLGNVEAFQLENDPSESLLEEKMRVLRLGINYHERVPAFFGKSLRNVKLRDFVSYSEAEIRKGLLNGNEEKFNKALSGLHEIGLIPDEKWDYAEMVAAFLKKSGLDFAPNAKVLLMTAALEASKMGVEIIGVEHLLLGAIREGRTATVFKHLRPELAVDAETVRKEVRRVYTVSPVGVTYTDIAITREVEELLKEVNEERTSNGENMISAVHIEAVLIKNMLKSGTLQELIKPSEGAAESE